MGEIKLLDCTLRDGGYVNDWEFGHDNLISIYERLVKSGVDIVEVGFLDDRRPFDNNRSIMPNTECAGTIWKDVAKKAPMTVGMIDYGTCKIENLQPCKDSFLDGIRVIFKKHIMHEAMAFCAEVKKLGYKVFSQLVSITSYNDDELMELIELVNDVKPYAVSMVDTYGLLHPEDMLHYYEILDKNVVPEVQIGFHAHNNFQLAYANAMAFLNKETNRDIVVDGTLYGMGKSAGNAPDELVAMYLNKNFSKNYNIDIMLEAIEESVMDIYNKAPWNYKLFFYLSAANRCHPNYVSYYQKKENLSISKLNDILGEIEPEDKKLLYDADIAEKLYNDFTERTIDDKHNYELLNNKCDNKNILLLGPGKNIQLQNEKVQKYISEKHPLIISVNYIPGAFNVDIVFTTNRYRYQQMTDSLKEIKNKNIEIIATSNVESMNDKFNYVVDRAPLLEKDEKIMDNSFLMLLKLLKKASVKEVTCAGFDGYSENEDNYFNPSMEYVFIKSEATYINKHMKHMLGEMKKDMNIDFITYSHYEEVEDIHSATF